jgi:hypothetical protein
MYKKLNLFKEKIPILKNSLDALTLTKNSLKFIQLLK